MLAHRPGMTTQKELGLLRFARNDGRLSHQIIARTLADLARRIEPQIFANLRATLVGIEHDQAVGAGVEIDQLKMQIGQFRQGERPVLPDFAFSPQGPLGSNPRPAMWCDVISLSSA